MNIEQIAELGHETNRAYCRLLADFSQRDWHDAPQWQKDSAISGVKFHLENPDATPSHSHEEWLRVKQDEGWKYGPVKDPEKKEHPCCVPYDDLPLEQRIKDTLFTSIVAALKPLLA
ncbi:MAG: hypothetical protein IMZ70_01345 [Candidatus Atribacteria bacterium]|nr:hypothetical protein [Candidatus Atribacteria bacterium]MBE3145007.1 hypothetical protein [Planctomycetota bacterium]